MTDVKPAILWEPKRAEKRATNGAITPGDYVGKFRTKVAPGTAGAYQYKGQNDAGVEWNYWGLDVDSIAGQLRWIDVRSTDFGQKIVLFVESAKALHQITIHYDVGNMHQIMNHLCGLGKELEVAFLNISYWVRKKVDANKKPKLDNQGRAIWAKDLMFRDVPQKWDFEAWKEFAQQNGLEWFKENRKGKDEWNYEAELNFWLARLVGVQKFLLTTPNVLPFCWNSITACEKESPGGNLTKEEIETAKEIYERVKYNYRFPFSRTDVGADSVLDAKPQSVQPENDDFEFPSEEPEYVTPEPQNVDGDDLPF